jgi:hypothetical protein
MLIKNGVTGTLFIGNFMWNIMGFILGRRGMSTANLSTQDNTHMTKFTKHEDSNL